MIDPYNELGRRLLAAVVSYRLGYAGVDHVLKNEIPATVNSYWADLGRDLDRAAADALGRGLADLTHKV